MHPRGIITLSTDPKPTTKWTANHDTLQCACAVSASTCVRGENGAFLIGKEKINLALLPVSTVQGRELSVT